MSVFNKAGRVHAPDSKYTGEEPDWHGWEKLTVEDFYNKRQRALGFYNYYLDAASLKPLVLAWMKKESYSKDEIATIKEAPPWYLPTTVGKLVRMMDRGMPPLHPDAMEYFATLPVDNEEDPQRVPKSAKTVVDEELRKALSTITADRKPSVDVAAATPEKKKLTPLDRIREKVDKEIMIHVDELIDRWCDISKPVATINLGAMLRDQKIPTLGCAPIIKWVDRHLAEYKAAYEKTDPQIVEGYAYLPKPNLRKIVACLESMRSDVAMHAKIKNSMRKPRVKKPRAADKQVARLKYQANSAEYSIESVSPSRIPCAQRLYIFNTKTRQLGVYYASGNVGFEVKGTSIKGYDPTLSFHATLRKPSDILSGILSATPKKLDKLFDGVKITRKKANGRFNEHTIILKVLENRP